MFVWFQRTKEKSIEDVPLRDALAASSDGERSQAHAHLAACFVNAAAVLLKQSDSRGTIFACTKALSYQPEHAKAMYRRAQVRAPAASVLPWLPSLHASCCLQDCRLLQAHYALDTTYDLELAVKDLQRAAKLAPGDTAVTRHLAKWRSELAQQTKKDKRTFANMFSRGNLYQDDAAAAPALGSPDSGLGWIKPPFCEDARRQAAEMGIDLEDPSVLAALTELHQNKVDAHEPTSGQTDSLANPGGFVDWWRALIAGRLPWRWHYLVYIFLWGHAVLRTYKIVQQFSRPVPADVEL